MISNKNNGDSNSQFPRRSQRRFKLRFLINQISHALRKNNNSKEEEEHNTEIDDRENKTKWTDVAGIIVSVILAIATFMLYQEATVQSAISKQAADAATSTATEAKKYDSLSLNKQDSIFNKNYQLSKAVADSTDSSNRRLLEFYKNSLKENSKFNRQTLEKSEKSIQSQIDAFKKTQDNFEKENEPYLQIAKAVLDTFNTVKPIEVKITIENLGKYAAKIKSLQLAMSICKDPHKPDRNLAQLAGGDSADLINRYIKDTPITNRISFDPYTKSQDSLFSTGKYTMYFWGYIKYTNLITRNPRIYKFKITFEPKLGATGDFILNENMDISKEKMDKVMQLEGWEDQ